MAMVWTLLGHSFIFVQVDSLFIFEDTFQAYLENVETYKDSLVNSFWDQWITNFTLSVDVFLVIGGCVLSYTFFRKWLKASSG